MPNQTPLVYTYRSTTAKITEHAINPVATCTCLTELDFLICVVPGAILVCVVDPLFPVLVTIPNEVVAVLELDTTAGSFKPQVGVGGPAVSLAHTPITH